MKLTDNYDNYELRDEDELLAQYVDDEILEQDFTVTTLEAAGLTKLMTPDGATTVLEAFKLHATKAQKSIVIYSKKYFNEDRVIVVSGQTVIDGYHHVVAAHQLGKDVRLIDLEEDPALGMKP